MKKFLVIRLSSIGDIVLTTPVVRCLKQQIPGSEIHFLVKRQFLPVLQANPYIDRIFSISNSINEVISHLKNEDYDHIIDLHKNFRSKGVILKLRKPASSFSKLNIRKWLLVRIKVNMMPSVHIVDRYFGAVQRLGVVNDDKGLDYFIPPEEKVKPGELPARFRNGYIGWVIGGKHSTKIYPANKIIAIIRKIDQPVVLLGGPEDEQMGDLIQESLGDLVYNACGKFSLNQSASLVEQARIICTNDTGLMHIAAAFKKEIFSFWGNTVPELGMFPYMPGTQFRSHIFEVKGLNCRPCSKIGFSKCPKGHFNCMEKINPEKLIRIVKT